MATRLVAGTFREVWREVVPLIGGASQTVTTGIRVNTVLLSNVFGILHCVPIGDAATLVATPSVTNGILTVTITNTSANAATWLLDVTLNHSLQQSHDSTAVGVIHSISDGGVGGASVPVLPSIAALRAFTETPVCVEVLGYYVPGDGGGGTFIWDGASAAVDDGGLVIRPNTLPPVGRWLRSYDDFITIRYFGAKGDGVADDTASIQAALNSSVGAVFVPPTGVHFLISDSLTVPDNTRVFGAGWRSRIRQSAREKNILEPGSQCALESLHLIGDYGSTGVAFEKNNGVYAFQSVNLTVSQCYIEGCEGSGIHLRNCLDVKVTSNFLFNNPWGSFPSASDIITYSTLSAGRGRILIDGNFCLSNNSQGIFVETENVYVVVNANMCVTLDPSTCIEGGTWTEMPAIGVRRRHAVVASYSNDTSGPRSITSNNICSNTLWSGVYLNGYANGRIVEGNFCSKNGLDGTIDLAAGIFIHGGDHDTIQGNIIADFQSSRTTVGGIVCLEGTNATIAGNLIYNGASFGINLGLYATRTNLHNNTLVHNAAGGILAVCIANRPDVGGFKITHNTIIASPDTIPATPGIRLDLQHSQLISRVESNRIVSYDRTTEADDNSGVYCRNVDVCDFIDNEIEGYYIGIAIQAYWSSGRHTNVVFERNRFDCSYGFGLSTLTDATVPLIGNVFLNGTVPVRTCVTSGGVIAGRVVHRLWNSGNPARVSYAIFEDVVPIQNTWDVGDRVYFTAPIAGGFVGAVCITGGAPGVWKTFGAISV